MNDKNNWSGPKSKRMQSGATVTIQGQENNQNRGLLNNVRDRDTKCRLCGYIG